MEKRIDKATERALKAYPKDIKEFVGVNGMKSVVDYNSWQRTIFLNGYHQAEKDNKLTWEDMRELYIIFAEVDTEIELCQTDIKPETIGYYQEVLKRFEKLKMK